MDALLIAVSATRPSLAWLAVILATSGAAIGCLFLFHVARKGGRLYLDKHTQTGKGRRLRLWFQRYGVVTVFVSLLSPVPLPTKVFVISAGALGVSPWSFLAAVVGGRLPRSIGLAYLGAQLGTHSAAWLRENAWLLTGVALLLAAGLLLLVRYTRRAKE